jgi:hypothetical protein
LWYYLFKQYRVRTDREFFDIDKSDIKLIFYFFNDFNNILDDEIKLNNSIYLYCPEYFKKRNYYNSSSNDKLKNKKVYILTQVIKKLFIFLW